MMTWTTPGWLRQAVGERHAAAMHECPRQLLFVSLAFGPCLIAEHNLEHTVGFSDDDADASRAIIDRSRARCAIRR
ncbi:MAG: hypothetical protein ABJA98_14250 [Acidobacteriota bacterium]